MVTVSRRQLLSLPAAFTVGAAARALLPRGREPFGRNYFAATETPIYDQSFAITTDRLSVGPGDELVVRGRAPGRCSTTIHRIEWTEDGSLPPAIMERSADLRPGAGSVDIDEWTVTLRTTVTERWRSGLYLAVARSDDGRHQRLAPFVVRAPHPGSPIVVQIPFATYHAYNAWGGASLYPYNSPNGPAHTLDIRRPFDGFDGAGFLFYGDWHLARWLDRERYEVGFVTSYDLHETGDHLDGTSLVMSAFHDEYWSTPMRTHFEAHLDRGGSAAFLAANSIYWRIRLETNTMVCHKASEVIDDPHPDITATWRSRLIDQPEHLLLGSHYGSYEFPYGSGYDWVVADERHWCYESTGLENGDRIRGLIGYEWDHCPDPKAPGVEVVASSRFHDRSGHPRQHDATMRTQAGGGTVVNIGTTYWPRALVGDQLVSHRPEVETITRNIVGRLGRMR